MSYILDALKKSEQEREQKESQVPGLHSVHGSPVATSPSGRAVLFIFLTVLLLVNGLFLYWFTRPGSAPEAVIAEEPTTEEPLAVEPAAVKPVSEQSLKEYLAAAPRVAGIRAVRISELPLNVQRQIPDIKFTSHIYADDPSLRLVNINSRSVREGGYVSDDLKLVGITEDGVVLSYQDYTFELSILRDWSFD